MRARGAEVPSTQSCCAVLEGQSWRCFALVHFISSLKEECWIPCLPEPKPFLVERIGSFVCVYTAHLYSGCLLGWKAWCLETATLFASSLLLLSSFSPVTLDLLIVSYNSCKLFLLLQLQPLMLLFTLHKDVGSLPCKVVHCPVPSGRVGKR